MIRQWLYYNSFIKSQSIRSSIFIIIRCLTGAQVNTLKWLPMSFQDKFIFKDICLKGTCQQLVSDTIKIPFNSKDPVLPTFCHFYPGDKKCLKRSIWVHFFQRLLKFQELQDSLSLSLSAPPPPLLPPPLLLFFLSLSMCLSPWWMDRHIDDRYGNKWIVI